MSARSLFARALAAAAVGVVTLTAPTAGAGAATDGTATVSIAPFGTDVDLGTGPIVTIGGVPAPGIDATVPVDGHTTVTVDNPTSSPAAAPMLAPAAPFLDATASSGPALDADTTFQACVAAALLDGTTPVGCGLPDGSTTPTLADALADVGACARVATLGSSALTACGASPGGGPASSLSAGLTGIDSDARVCLAATVLGLTDADRCPAPDSTTDPSAGGSDGSGGSGGQIGASAVDANVCLGLAVLTGTDADPCPVASIIEPTDPIDGATGNGTADGAAASPAVLTGVDDASGTGSPPDGADSLALTGADSLLLSLAGLGSVAAGLAVRRAAGVRHPG